MKTVLDIKGRENLRVPYAVLERGLARIDPRLLDRIEQAVILLLWMFLVGRVLRSSHIYAPLTLISETMVLIFVLIRRPTHQISRKLDDWLLAIAATSAPLLITPDGYGLHFLIKVGVVLVVLGNVGQAIAKLILRRSFGVAPANRGVTVTGPYAFVRHPMYASYLLVHIGNVMLFPSALNLLVYGLGWWAQILRLRAEEALLLQDPAYQAYAGKVRWRLLPGLF